MVSTVWSVSCLLFYSWCPSRVQSFVKVGARAAPCPMESASSVPLMTHAATSGTTLTGQVHNV